MEYPWADRFAPWIFTRGHRLWKNGRILRIDLGENTVAAILQDGENCFVALSLENGSQVRRMGCSCIYAEDGSLCSHMAAVLIALQEDGAPLSLPPRGDPLWKERQEIWNPEVGRRTRQFAGRRRAEVTEIIDRWIARPGRRSEKTLSESIIRLTEGVITPQIRRGQTLDAFLVVCTALEAVYTRNLECAQLQKRCTDWWLQMKKLASPPERQKMYQWFSTTPLQMQAVRTMLFDLSWEPEQLRYTLLEFFPSVFRRSELPDGARVLQMTVMMAQRLGWSYAALRSLFGRIPDWSVYCPLAVLGLEDSMAQAGLVLLRLCRDTCPNAPAVLSQCRRFLARLYQKNGITWEELVQLFTFPANSRAQATILREILSKQDWSAAVSLLLEKPSWAPLKLDLLMLDGRYRDVYELLLESGSLQDLNRCSAMLEQWSSAKLRTLYAKMCLKLADTLSTPRDCRALLDTMRKLASYNGGKQALEKVVGQLHMRAVRNPLLRQVLQRSGY